MTWTILIGLILALSCAVLVANDRRVENDRHAHRLAELRRAKEKGSHKARLQYPHVDLSRCVGCGTCVRACPEEDVLALIHGQALVVHGALLVEPTETESKESLDQFVAVLRGLAERAKAGDAAYFRGAPRLTPRRRLDETAAARKPVLRWRPEPERKEAAE